MGLSIRMVCNGVMALSVGTLAGWLYSARPADVAAVTAKLMNMVGPIVTPRVKEPAATPASKTQPASNAPAPVAAAPPAKTPAPAPVVRRVKQAAPAAKSRASAIVPPPKPKTAAAPKKRRPADSDD